MSVGVAIVLGILQGLTEFFPVSSSGHLALFGAWFGLTEPDLTFDILVHLATLAAILIYFRDDWFKLANMLRGKGRGDLPKHIIPYLIISMIPAGLVGVFGKEHIEWVHARPEYVGAFLLVTGTVLLAGFKLKNNNRPLQEITIGIVIAMAFAQAFAVAPGISRAGMTIMMGLFLGMERFASARFSFLMAVPVIGGAGVLAIMDLMGSAHAMTSEMWLAYGAGFIAAMFSGFFALVFLMKLLEGKRFFLFGFYCLAMGLFAIFF